jgi:predicted small secreted protein
MWKPRALRAALVAATPALAGCNTPSVEDVQRLEKEVADLRARLEAAETRISASEAMAASGLDSAGQCNLVCLNVSERLDGLYLEILPR